MPGKGKYRDRSNSDCDLEGGFPSGGEQKQTGAAQPQRCNATELCKYIADQAGTASLDLRGKFNGDLSPTDLTSVLSAIPDNVTTVDLTNNNLGFFSDTQLTTAFDAMSNAVTTLYLTDNKLGHYFSGTELAKVFATLGSLTTLNLDRNELGYLPGDQLAIAFAALSYLTTLSLSNNRLDLFPTFDIQKRLCEMEDYMSLIRANGDLIKRSGEDLAKALTAIPSNVTTLILAGNNLGDHLSAADLITAFAAMKRKVSRLDLTNNNLGIFAVEDFAKVLTAIPPTATNAVLDQYLLDLNSKKCADLSYDELKIIFPILISTQIVDEETGSVNPRSLQTLACVSFFVSFKSQMASAVASDYDVKIEVEKVDTQLSHLLAKYPSLYPAGFLLKYKDVLSLQYADMNENANNGTAVTCDSSSNGEGEGEGETKVSSKPYPHG